MDTPGERAAREELQRRAESTIRIVLRPLAGPLALGFLGLAAATFVRAGLELGWVEPAEGKKVALIAIAFTVPLQFTASVIGFLARDGVAATGMGLLAVIAVYAALATELEDVMKRTVLPLGRRGKGAQALEGVLYDQVAQVQKEPGVRLQL